MQPQPDPTAGAVEGDAARAVGGDGASVHDGDGTTVAATYRPPDERAAGGYVGEARHGVRRLGQPSVMGALAVVGTEEGIPPQRR